MITDYYVLKKQKLNLDEMYKTHGIYYYSYGVNWRAFAAFFLGLTPLLPGFAKSIDVNLNVGGAWKVYTFAWLFGFTVSSLSYFVICTYVSRLGEAVVDVAVYPAQLGEGGDEESGVAETIDEKGAVRKEVDIIVDEVSSKDSKS